MPASKRGVSAGFLLDLVENANDLVQSVDMEGRLLYVNRAWRETLGYTEDEIPGLNLWDVIHPDSLAHCKGHFGQVCEAGSLNHLEAAFRAKDGHKVLLEGSVNCRYVRGKPASTRGIFRNITQMKEMESRAQLRSQLLDYAGDAITLRSTQGTLYYCNRAAYERLGYTYEEYFKLGIRQITDAANAAQVDRRIKEILKKGELVMESVRVAKDGNVLPVEVHARTLGVGTEKVILSVEHDITDRKRVADALRDESERLAAIIDAAQDGIVIIDDTGKITRWNAAATRMFGFAEAEVIGKDMHTLLSPPEYRELQAKGFDEFVATGQGPAIGTTLEASAIRRDKTEFPIELSLASLKVGTQWHAVGILRDITKRKIGEQRLKDTNQQLQEANQAKSRFVASMSHELRTPLNAIIGLSGLILDGTLGELNDELKDCIADILGSGQRLLNLINDILDMSKVEAGKIDITIVDIDLESVLENAIHVVKPLVDKSRLSLTLELPPTLPAVRADAARLEQVMVNLLSNAIKFTPPGGKIEVKAVADDGWWQVSVNDDGVGIKKRDLDNIFDPYTQAETLPDKKSEGTGLGLQISKQFVELMGGTIWAESIFGKGSTFYFALPVAKAKR
jgi:PAS domain S-box-containing protein